MSSDYIIITLTKGKETIISVEDADLAELRWRATSHQDGSYARNNDEYLHRVILSRLLGRPLFPREECDHKNRNRLDNRRDNLRLATAIENKRNASLPTNNTSGYKGVSYFKAANIWEAYITINGKKVFLGFYNTVIDAAITYNHAAKFHFGEFANFNDIPFWENIHPERRERDKALFRNNTSGFRNISRNNRTGKWKVTVQRDGKTKYLGEFRTLDEAVNTRDKAMKEYGNDER